MLPDQEGAVGVVSYEAAYNAAMIRLQRLTQAVVLSEAQRLVLERRVSQLETELRQSREVKSDAACAEGGAETGSEADPAPPFSD